MKVVSCYRAAQIAQVSRQLIIKRKKINADNKSKYLYFCYDPVKGNFGIDIESKLWLEYMQKRRNTLGYSVEKERLLTNKTDDKQGGVDQGNSVDESAIIDIVVSAIKEILKPSAKDMNRLLKLIDRKYDEVRN